MKAIENQFADSETKRTYPLGYLRSRAMDKYYRRMQLIGAMTPEHPKQEGHDARKEGRLGLGMLVKITTMEMFPPTGRILGSNVEHTPQ